VYNVVDPRNGDEGFIQQGQVFQIVGQGFGNREGQVVMKADGEQDWVTLRDRCIQDWRDDSVTVVIPESPFRSRQTRVAVGIVSSTGRSDVIGGISFRTLEAAITPGYRPTRPGSDYFGHHQGGGTDRPYEQAPLNPTWSVAARSGLIHESPRSTNASRTLKQMGAPLSDLPADGNTRLWSGATVGVLVMGELRDPPWPHFIVSVATGVPHADRLASTLAEAASEGYPVRAGAGVPPPGGFPLLRVSKEQLRPDQQYLPGQSDREDNRIDAQMLSTALRMNLPPESGPLTMGQVDEIGSEQWGPATGVVKCLSGETDHLVVLAFLSRVKEPVNSRGRTYWQSVRSLRIAVISNGSRGESNCRHLIRD